MAAILANYAYAEGTWTPILNVLTPPTGLTYSSQVGRYTRVGNLVIASFDLQLSSMGTGGVGFLALGGLPIPVIEEYPILFNAVSGSGFTGAGVAATTMYLAPIGGTPSASIAINSLSAGTVFLNYTYLTATAHINGTMFYNVT